MPIYFRISHLAPGGLIVESITELDDAILVAAGPVPGCDRLTLRECDVLRQITSVASNKEEAKTLGISPRTVENHRVQIMQKLGAKNAVDFVRIVLSPARPRDKPTSGGRTPLFPLSRVTRPPTSAQSPAPSRD